MKWLTAVGSVARRKLVLGPIIVGALVGALASAGVIPADVAIKLFGW